MRKFTLITLMVLAIVATSAYSQGFNYQTILRNSAGIEKNKSVVLEFSIKQGSQSGSTVYSESHAVTTNEYGLINVVVGEGTPISGVFANIDWSKGPYYMNVAIDSEDMGTSRLNSLPYANYANEAATSATSVNSDTAHVAMKLDIAGASAGDVLYFDGTNWVRLAKGSDDQVLTLSSGLPVWKDAGSGSTGEPKLGEAFSDGIIVAIYPDGDVLVAYNALILDGSNKIMDYATAESKVAALGGSWKIPSKREFNMVLASADYLADSVWEVTDDYLSFWTSTAYIGGGNFTYFEGFYQPLTLDVVSPRVIPVKKVAYP